MLLLFFLLISFAYDIFILSFRLNHSFLPSTSTLSYSSTYFPFSLKLHKVVIIHRDKGSKFTSKIIYFVRNRVSVRRPQNKKFKFS